MSIVIKAENISKQYRLGEVGTGSLKDDFKRWRYRMQGKDDPFLTVGEVNDRTVKSSADYVWALQNINFKVKQGETLGIIGRNGAGKSTLLKILSRTTSPTTGSLKMKGRIASLLEVGTGFHGELSGRENIFLNGAIMGMSKEEIRKKFDEIVDFAGVEKYIDTPVKRYSSGMYVRLAFGVAAHLEPDILIVDEVLAVGDAEFQRKAIGKMQDVSRSDGRTVLFVSHNMASIRNLCSSAIFMENGGIRKIGTSEDIIKEYLQVNSAVVTTDLSSLAERTDRTGSGKLKFTDITVLDNYNKPIQEVISGDYLQIRLKYGMTESIDSEKVIFAITFYDQNEEVISLMISDEMGVKFHKLREQGEIIFEIPRLLLRGGSYHLRVFASYMDTAEANFLDSVYNAYTLNVLPGDIWQSGKTNRSGSHMIIEGTITSK